MGSKERQTAIISGASSGIGQAVTKKLLENDYLLGLNARNRENLVNSIDFPGKDSISISAGDISDYGVAVELVSTTLASFGSIKALVINAGVGFFGSFMDIAQSATEEIIRTNILGSINLVKAAMPELLKNAHSDIVFISSTAGTRGGANEAIYAATKHAQNGLAGSLDREYRKQGVRVSIIAPGATRTNFGIGNGREASGIHQKDFLNPNDVAETVAFTLSLPKNARIQYLSILPMSQQS